MSIDGFFFFFLILCVRGYHGVGRKRVLTDASRLRRTPRVRAERRSLLAELRTSGEGRGGEKKGGASRKKKKKRASFLLITSPVTRSRVSRMFSCRRVLRVCVFLFLFVPLCCCPQPGVGVAPGRTGLLPVRCPLCSLFFAGLQHSWCRSTDAVTLWVKHF